MRDRRRVLLSFLGGLALVALLAPAIVWADFAQTEWQYVKSIDVSQELRQEQLVEILPDPEVFAGSAVDLVDARIVAGDETEVPYQLKVGRPERTSSAVRATLRDLGYVAGQYDTFVADVGREGILHNEIEVHTLSKNFRRAATVETSTNGASWTEVAEQPIYDFTVKERSFTTRDTRVRYADTAARFLRVRIADDGEGPLGITGANVLFVKKTPARETLWPASALDIDRDSDRRATLVEVDLGAPGLPSHRIAIRTPDVNFYRDATVETSTDRKDWTIVSKRDSVYAYDTPKFVGESLDVTYRESSSRYLRLVIRDEDSPPLRLEGVDVWGLEHGLLFTATPWQTYRLYYGNPEARRPLYDVERVFPYLETEGLPQATLGPQTVNPSFVEDKPPVSERFPWLLSTVIAIAAIGVAVLLLGIVRRAKKLLPPPGP